VQGGYQRLTWCSDGVNRFDMTFDPCSFNVTSLCPLSSDVPVSAHAVVPVGGQPLGELSSFPFNLPDFEGSAKLQIHASSSDTEIGCFQAVVTNGKTLSHPEIIAPVLGGFTLVAILASFLTAAYGVSIPHMRMHHAHSLSVLVVFETFQTIFFSGALSVDWPPILVAWWSNFAWSAGFIYISGLVQSMNGFTGVTGNASQIRGSISQIFGRSPTEEEVAAVSQETAFNSSFLDDYTWSGSPVGSGVPLPGTWPGFPSTLSAHHIPMADAFMVGLIWLLVATGLVILAITSLKIVLEGLASGKKIKEDRLASFRSHWVAYLGHALLRTLIIAFFTIMTLAMLQFTIRMTVGPIAVATVVFILGLIGIIALVASGCKTRTREGRFQVMADRAVFYHTKLWKKLPAVTLAWGSTLREHDVQVRALVTIPLFRARHVNTDPNRKTVHLDEPFVEKFGWLTARYRRTRWWFLAYHITYLFCRAAFLGGGWRSPHVQVYGVLAVDIVNFAVAALLVPFEGARNTAMGVWILGICKIVTTGISIVFLPEFNHSRSDAVALGIVIVVIQALTVVALLMLIVLSAISSWISMMRNRQEMDPDWLEPVRVRYFTAMEEKARDARFHVETQPPEPTPRFSMVSIRRRPKIEDEDEDAAYEPEHTLDDGLAEDRLTIRGNDHGSHSRTSSVGPRLSTGSLPRAARPYRVSWSSREFVDVSPTRPDSVVTKRLSGITCIVTDCDASNTSSTALVRPQSSMWSLNTPTPSASRSSSPSPGRLSREIGGDGRRPPTALPEAPEPQE